MFGFVPRCFMPWQTVADGCLGLVGGRECDELNLPTVEPPRCVKAPTATRSADYSAREMCKARACWWMRQMKWSQIFFLFLYCFTGTFRTHFPRIQGGPNLCKRVRRARGQICTCTPLLRYRHFSDKFFSQSPRHPIFGLRHQTCLALCRHKRVFFHYSIFSFSPFKGYTLCASSQL